MKLLGAFLLASLLAAPAAAQLTSPDTTRLQDRSVTATKVSAVRGVAPAATTVISGDELRARGIQFVTDALHDVPGLIVVPSGSYGAVTSIFLRGGESDYVKVLLDGVPLNEPGGSINLADLSTENLDRIEIVRGPASVLYGADAMSGVIQLFSRKGRDHPGGFASIWRGTFNNQLYDLGLAGRMGLYSLSTTGSQFKSDGTYPFNSAYNNKDASLNLDHLAKGGTRFGLTTRYDDAQGNYPTDYTGTPVDSNQFTRNRALDLGLSASTPFKSGTLLSFQGFSSRLQSDFSNRPDSPGDTLDYGYDADMTSITSRRGGDLHIDFSSKNGSVLSFGGGYEQEKENQTSRTVSNFGTGATTDTASFAADRSTKQVYGQGFLTPSQFITLQLGARLDDNTAFGSFFTWKTGAAFNRGGTRLWISAGTAFKAPTFSELFARSSFEVGNPDLNPERSRNIEVGITLKNAGSRRVLGLTGFTQRFSDLIQFINALPGATNYVNLGAADSRGLEATLALKPSRAFHLQAHATWLHTEVIDSGSASSVTFTQGERLLRRPTWSGGANATWLFGLVTAVAVVNYVGARDDADYRNFPTIRTTLPSYHTVDVSIDRALGRPKAGESSLDLMLRGENLFNASYDQVVGFPGRGRTLLIGVRSHY